MATEKTTLEVVLGALGALYAFERLISLFPPPVGPRLKTGEVYGREATARAARAYWEAENAASRGRCDVAKGFFAKGEHFRTMAEDRAERGDQTTQDVRGSQRLARDALKLCQRGANPLEGIEKRTRLVRKRRAR